MKKLIAIIGIISVCYSCKQKTKTKIVEPELSIAEKIANAHGFSNWGNVQTFAFTFGGKTEDPSSGRAWVWNPKTNEIKITQNNETTEYNRNSMDSIAVKTDRAFINDKFWALIPFQLVWDEGKTISKVETSKSPVKNETLNKITITYTNKGGYTPGDAYDIYFDKNYIIREWSYRKGNTTQPTLSNTFENYNDYNGIKVAQEHKFAKGDRNLLIRNVRVKIEE